MSGAAETIYRSDLKGPLAVTRHPEQLLLVADSWLVRDGRMIAPDLHQQRFFNSCRIRHGIGARVLLPLWYQALSLIPAEGLWFPRMELAGKAGQPVFQCRIRPVPMIGETVKLMVCDAEDFRKAPRHKGPDIQWLNGLRRQVLDAGADEGIITTSKGFVLEGLTTSILWWEKRHGQERLCTVPDLNRILPGTIRRLILTVARQERIPVSYRLVMPEQLNDCEVWAVNALHGIRPAVMWEKSPFMPRSDMLSRARLAWWRNAINRYAVRFEQS